MIIINAAIETDTDGIAAMKDAIAANPPRDMTLYCYDATEVDLPRR